MRYTYIMLVLLLVSCAPCKKVARHPECFPVDTIREITESVRYEKEYITRDSIVFDSVFCAPDSVIIAKTIYKTVHNNTIDTIYTLRESTKINPVNLITKQENTKISKKLKNRRWLIWYFVGSIISYIILIYLKIRP